MTAAPRPSTILIDPLDIEAAASALCGRCGDAGAEAFRLATLREMMTTSRELCTALTEFTKQAGTHLQGVHCTAGMQADARQLDGALVAWADAIHDAADSYRRWQDARMALRYHDDVAVFSHDVRASNGGPR